MKIIGLFFLLILFALSLIFFVLNIFVFDYINIEKIFLVINFIFFLFAVSLKNIKKSNKKIKKSKFFIISQVVLSVLFVSCLIILAINGGSPQIINGEYCTVNHGEIIKEGLSYKLFKLIKIAENQLLLCASMIMNTFSIEVLSKKSQSIEVKT